MPIDPAMLSDCSTGDPDCLLNDKKVQKILSESCSVSVLSYDREETVFKEGKPIVGFFVICDGLVREISCAGIGNRITLKVFKSGDILTSDAFFLDENIYQTRAQTLTEVKVLFIERSVFPRLMKVAGTKIGMKLARNMRYLRKNLEFSSCPVLKRLAYWLAKLLPESSNKFDISNRELAEIVGCSHVTVSRKLSRLEDKELIQKDGKEIIVLNKAKLKEEVSSKTF